MRKTFFISISMFLVGTCFGFLGRNIHNSYIEALNRKASQIMISAVKGRFSYAPFSFMYPKQLNAIWLSSDSGFYYSVAGIPTDNNGLVISYRPTVLPRLEVGIGAATSTDFEIMSYINTKYPADAFGKYEYRTGLSPFESKDHQFSGYFVKYEVDGMAGYSGEVLVFKLNKGCGSKNPHDCSYVAYTVDNISGMYTPEDFRKIASSIKYSQQ